MFIGGGGIGKLWASTHYKHCCQSPYPSISLDNLDNQLEHLTYLCTYVCSNLSESSVKTVKTIVRYIGAKVETEEQLKLVSKISNSTPSNAPKVQ